MSTVCVLSYLTAGIETGGTNAATGQSPSAYPQTLVESGEGVVSIARQFGLHHSTIQDIAAGKSWRYA